MTSTMLGAVYNAITKALNHSVVRVVLGFLITTFIFGHRPPPYSPASSVGLTFHCGFYSAPPLSSSPLPSPSSAAEEASLLSTGGTTNVCQEDFVSRTPVNARICWCRCHDKVDFGVSDICLIVAHVLIFLGICGICVYYSATPDERQRFLRELLDILACVVELVKENVNRVVGSVDKSTLNGWIRTLKGGCTTGRGGRKETLQEKLIKKLDKFGKVTHVNVNNLAIKSIATERLNELRGEDRVVDVKRSMEQPEEHYQEIFIEELEKFDEVTNTNGNIEIKKIATGKANESCGQYRVATILVDAAEVHELPITNGVGDLEDIFRKLRCISPSHRQILTKLFSLHDGGNLKGTLERPHSGSSSNIQGVLVLWAAKEMTS